LHTCTLADDLLGVRDSIAEGTLKKTILTFILGLLLCGCSTSGPDITDTAISDENPVFGQRILLQVYSLTDNFPMTYTWQATGGEFDQWDENYYLVYWTAPEIEGEQTITCVVRDDDDEEDVHTFTVNVSPREIDDTLVSENVLSLEKQTFSYIGGVWVSTQSGDVRFISSSINESTSWDGAFSTMHVALDSTFLAYTLWGAQSQGIDITILSEGYDPTILNCETCDESDVIHDLTIDVIDGSLLWVGTDSGMHWYDSSAEEGEDEWGTYKSEKTNAFYQGTDFVYAATSTGIYELDPFAQSTDPIYTGDTCAVLEVENDDDTVTLWHITDAQVYEDGQLLADQPDNVVCSLDVDLNNNIWCGKYWWNGVSWQSPSGLEDIEIAESVVSYEGLVYLVSTSGTLLRW
jgi:hypothetical protein